jgi:dCTP deaminase
LLYKEENEVFDADSVDLRLGSHFLLPKPLDQPYFSPDSGSASTLYVKVHVPLGQFLVVPAHQTILGATLEFIKLPHDVSGQVLTKSSVARTFIVVETAPWIHPEYRGCLTLEIANVSNTPVLLYPGRRICQLVLMDVAPTDHEDNDQTTSKQRHEDRPKQGATYFGPVYPEGPKFRNPQDDLLGIGVKRVSILRRTQLYRKAKDWEDEFCEQQNAKKPSRSRLP